MWHELRSGWREPSFWRAWWRNGVGRESKLALAACLAGAIAAAGFFSAAALSSGTEKPPPEIRRVTVWHRVVRTVVRPHTVVSVRTVERPRTVVRDVTVSRVVPGPVRTVVQEATPPSTVTREVTAPSRTVTRAVTQTRVLTETSVVTEVQTVTLPPITVTVTVKRR